MGLSIGVGKGRRERRRSKKGKNYYLCLIFPIFIDKNRKPLSGIILNLNYFGCFWLFLVVGGCWLLVVFLFRDVV